MQNLQSFSFELEKEEGKIEVMEGELDDLKYRIQMMMKDIESHQMRVL